MATVLKLGPGDHGRPMTYDEFMAGDYNEGYRYELIRGRLYVSPMPNFPHDWVEDYVFRRLDRYAEQRPDVINKVVDKCRVFLPDDEDVTAPEPDVAAYAGFPLEREWQVDWQELSPVLAVEVLGGEDDDKDLVRNVDLYWRVPSIQEYWVYDIREDPGRPVLKVFRREGRDAWREFEFDADATYTTPLLPAFVLPVEPTDAVFGLSAAPAA